METLVDLLRDAADRYGDRTAVTAHIGLRSQTWSYRRLWAAARTAAHHLREVRGLEPGARVVVWAANSPEVVAVLFGALAARLVVVPVDPSATAGFVQRVIDVTHADLVVSTSAAVRTMGVPTVRPDSLPFDSSTGLRPDTPTPDDLAEIVFTSGTTGTPKGVMLTHRNITADVEAGLRLTPRRRFRLLSLLPLSHMFEQTVGLFGPLSIGATVHYPSNRTAPVIGDALRRQRISAMVVVPQILELMLRDVERAVAQRGASAAWARAHRIASHLPLPARRLLFHRVHRSFGGHLAYVVCGGAHLPAELAASWERMGVRVIEGYGTTECSPVVAGNTYWDRCPGSVGRPLDGVEVAVAGDGEILVRGPIVFAGYWDAPEATAAAIDAAGWFHTGDLGLRDLDGRLHVQGRASERIVLASGLNVYPEDVERELCAEPEVAQCAVVAVPDADGNARVRAVVVPAITADGTPAGRAAVEAAVRRAGTRLAPYQRPTGLTIWPEADLPRTALLKVKRHEVGAALGADAASSSTCRPQDETLGGDVVDRLRSILATVTGADAGQITETSDLTLELGLDSLGRVELAVALQDDLGVVVDDADLADIGSLDELRALVDRHAEPTAGGAPPSWPQAWWARVARDAIQQAILFPLHRGAARPFTVEHQELLRGIDGPLLVVANHCSHLDTPSILRALPRRIRRRTAVAAATDYFYRSTVVGGLSTLALGTFPFSRRGAVRASIDRCGELVDAGWTIVIYPEGTRSTTGDAGPFRRGIGLLAAQLDIPVVPVGILGTYAVWPKGRRRPTPGPVTVRIGAPLRIASGADHDATVHLLQRAVDELVGSTPGPSPRSAITAADRGT